MSCSNERRDTQERAVVDQGGGARAGLERVTFEDSGGLWSVLCNLESETLAK